MLRRDLAANPDHILAELLNYHKDETTFWNELAISPAEDEAGAIIYYFASLRDITEPWRVRQPEPAERWLLMEIDHRAVDALAMAKIIGRLSQAKTVEDISASLQGRIGARAWAHQLLARTRRTAGNLEAL